MILLISSHPEAEQCVPVLSRELGERVECVGNLRTAAAKLRDNEPGLVVVDQAFVETHTGAVQALLSHAASAVPLFFNPVVHGTKRLVVEARAALRRREFERRSAAENALSTLRNDLRSDVTAILLSSQLALSGGTVPDPLAANLQSICALAERLGKKLA